MAIKFLRDYSTKAHPPEHFKLGQVVEDRDDASEAHFVNRDHAAYVRDGRLIDRFGKEVEDPQPWKADPAPAAPAVTPPATPPVVPPATPPVTPPVVPPADGPDYERDNLAEADIGRANKPVLLVIAKHEGVELPDGDETTVKVLRELITAKRTPAA